MAPRSENYSRALVVLGILYALGGLAFIFIPNEILYLVNVMPTVFKLAEAIPLPAERFWIVMAAAMMATLAALSFFSARYPLIRGYAWIHVLCKTVSGTGFLYMFFNDRHYFIYLLGTVLDAALIIFVTYKTMMFRPGVTSP